jgi:putative phage-type endonuclease
MDIYAPENLNGAKLLGVFDSGSPEWHEARRLSVGGSEVGTILGLNPYESAYALWAKKTGKIASQIQENWAIRFGKAFEEPILKLWQEEHPDWEVFSTGTYQDPRYDFIHVNPDALARHRETGEWQILEVKTGRQTWESVPPAYIAQLLHYMGVLQIKKGHIVAVAGMTWNEYEVEYNQDQIDIQLQAIIGFWASVVNDIKPDWDGSESTYNAVRAIRPEIADTDVELGQLGLDLLEAQKTADMAYTRLMRLKSEVMDTMGFARYGYVNLANGQTRRVASRQLRAGMPVLITNKKGN